MLRKASPDEERLIDELVRRSTLRLARGWEAELLVETMKDGGMGSLLLFPNGERPGKRAFGGVASELEFKDEDGVDVLVSLNLDKEGRLFEVDSWKVDFKPLTRIPDEL